MFSQGSTLGNFSGKSYHFGSKKGAFGHYFGTLGRHWADLGRLLALPGAFRDPNDSGAIFSAFSGSPERVESFRSGDLPGMRL